MPHDRKNRVLDKGDYVRVETYYGPKVGEVVKVTPGDTCNLTLAILMPGCVQTISVNTKDSELVMRADGIDPNVPAGEQREGEGL